MKFKTKVRRRSFFHMPSHRNLYTMIRRRRKKKVIAGELPVDYMEVTYSNPRDC